MNKLIKSGRIIFATGFTGLGILCFISKDFIVGRPPAWPAGLEINPALAYVSGAILIVAALAILFTKKRGAGCYSDCCFNFPVVGAQAFTAFHE